MMKSKPKIIYLISHGLSARGTFQTGILDRLVKSGNNVCVLARNEIESELRSIVERTGATFDTYSPPKGNKYDQLNNFRNFIHQNIRKNPTLWERFRRNAYDENISVQRKFLNRLYLIIGDLIRSNQYLLRKYRLFEEKLIDDSKAIDVLQKHKPDIVISTRPMAQQEYFLLAAAEKLNIKKVFYILSWDNITSKGFFPVTADFYLTWGPIMNEELNEYYQVEKNKIFNNGVTHFDVHHQVKNNPDLEKWLNPIGLDHSKPYILFTLTSSYYCPDEIEIIEWLSKKIEKGEYGEDMQLVLRPHMNNFIEGLSDPIWKKRLTSLQSDKVAIDFPEMNNSLLTWFLKHDDMLKLSNLLNGAIINLNSGSTIALEAALLDKPVILPLFETEELAEWLSVKRLKNYIHLRKLIDLKGVEVVNSFKELDRSIKKYVNDPGLGRELRENAVFQECYKNDGKATDRFIENIQTIVDKI